MPNIKVSALTSVSTPASGDLIPLVDVSDTAQAGSGSTRGLSVTNLAANLAPRVNAKQTATGNIALTVGTATGYSWRVLGDGTLGWGASESSAVDVVVARTASNVLQTNGQWWATKTLSAGPTNSANHRLWAEADTAARPVAGFKGATSQTADLTQWLNSGGSTVANVTSAGQGRFASLGVGNSVAATTPGSVTRKMEVFNASGTSLGFVAIYGSIS